RTRRPGGAGKEADSPHQRSGRLHQDLVRIGRGATAQRDCAAGAVRGRSESGDRACLVPAVQPDPPALPRSAGRNRRRRDQHDRREHENRGAAGAVSEPHLELQSQSEELRKQQEELKRSNAELEAQATTLRTSEELLKDQQEELQQVNEELEEKASLLAEQNRKVESKNEEVEAARVALEEKAEQLSLSSKYKSEFLANMSHELRTPLNSLLILARLLSENKDGNLSPKQVEFAQTILTSGSDLLSLINDVLDLSKVEAGKMDVNPTDVRLPDVKEFVERSFNAMAEQKSLNFDVDLNGDLPQTMYTDGGRLQQVLKNLLSNAFKFTQEGSVTLTVRRAEKGRR